MGRKKSKGKAKSRIKYERPEDVPDWLKEVTKYLSETPVSITEVSRITGISPEIINEYYTFNLNLEDFDEIRKKAMTPAERNRKHQKKKRREIHESVAPYKIGKISYERTDAGEYENFVDVLRLFENGEVVKKKVPTWNRYLMALYKTAIEPRSVKSLRRRESIHPSRLNKLMSVYKIYEKDENKSRPTYTATEKGKQFLIALYPGLKKLMEMGPELETRTEYNDDDMTNLLLDQQSIIMNQYNEAVNNA